MAVQTIKSVARRRWADDDERRRFSWYEPLTDEDALARAVRWVLGHPQLFLNTTSDASLLRRRARRSPRAAAPGRPTPRCRPTSTPRTSAPLFDGAALERI